MKFLRVLCVVLYLQCEVSVRGQNNNHNVQYPTQTSKLIAQRNVDTPLNFAAINPPEMNWHREHEKQRSYPINRDRQLMSQESSTYGSIRDFPEYGNVKEVRNINDVPANRESSIRLLQELRGDQNPSNMNSYHNIRGSDNREIQRKTVIPRDLSGTLLESSEYRNHQLDQNIALASKQREAGLKVDSSYLNAQPLQLLNNPSLSYKDDVSEDLLKSRLHDSEYSTLQPIQMTKPVPLKLEEDFLPTVNAGSGRSINSKSISHEPEKEIRLELQGVSPEYIQSFINKNIPVEKKSLQNSFQYINEPEVLKGLYNHHYIKSQLDNEPKSQNPSAEILYKMQKALPYEIQLSNEGISGVNHIPSQETNKFVAPEKRFTVIHPDGRIEHVDQIETIIKNRPNYVMFNSKDILKRLEERPNTFSRPLIPYLNQYAHSVINQAQNQEISNLPSIVTQKLPVIAKKSVKSTVDGRLVSSPENEVLTITKNLNNPIVAPLKPAPVINMTETNPLESLTLNNTATDTARQNLTQNNILRQSGQNIIVGSAPTHLNITESPKSDDIIDKPILNNSISDLNITDSKSRSSLNNSEVAISQALSHENINQTDLLYPPILLANSSATQQDYISDVTTANNQTTTIPSSNSNKNFTIELENTNAVNNTNIDLETSTINETYSNTSQNMENNNNTGFWFQADEHFWESLLSRNGTQNQYFFLFVPPKPSTEKDTRTTIYPNGTTIEEVIETENKDGVPKILRTTKITYANSTVEQNN